MPSVCCKVRPVVADPNLIQRAQADSTVEESSSASPMTVLTANSVERLTGSDNVKNVDPCRPFMELMLADMESLDKRINALEKKAKGGDAEAKAPSSGFLAGWREAQGRTQIRLFARCRFGRSAGKKDREKVRSEDGACT